MTTKNLRDFWIKKITSVDEGFISQFNEFLDDGQVWVLTNVSNLAPIRLYKSTGGKEDVPGTTMFMYKI